MHIVTFTVSKALWLATLLIAVGMAVMAIGILSMFASYSILMAL